MARLIENDERGVFSRKTEILEGMEGLKALAHPLRIKILESIIREPKYPSALADELGISEQSMYYHMKKLKESGIVSVVSEEFRGGSVAKFYESVADAFAFTVPGSQEMPVERDFSTGPEGLKSFFSSFLDSGSLDLDIVVGSPDPHGPNQVRGRDGHHGIDLAAVLGNVGHLEGSIVSLDVDVVDEESMKGNKILVGGPLTNMATEKFNDSMPVRFAMERFPYRELESLQSGDSYMDENIGVISRCRNPFDSESSVVMVAGVRNSGTRAAVMAVTEFHEKVFEDYDGEDKWGRVVKGMDMDGDGEIDDIKILE